MNAHLAAEQVHSRSLFESSRMATTHNGPLIVEWINGTRTDMHPDNLGSSKTRIYRRADHHLVSTASGAGWPCAIDRWSLLGGSSLQSPGIEHAPRAPGVALLLNWSLAKMSCVVSKP